MKAQAPQKPFHDPFDIDDSKFMIGYRFFGLSRIHRTATTGKPRASVARKSRVAPPKRKAVRRKAA